MVDLASHAQSVKHELAELVCVGHGDVQEVVIPRDVKEVDGFRELEQVLDEKID